MRTCTNKEHKRSSLAPQESTDESYGQRPVSSNSDENDTDRSNGQDNEDDKDNEYDEHNEDDEAMPDRRREAAVRPEARKYYFLITVSIAGEDF